MVDFRFLIFVILLLSSFMGCQSRQKRLPSSLLSHPCEHYFKMKSFKVNMVVDEVEELKHMQYFIKDKDGGRPLLSDLLGRKPKAFERLFNKSDAKLASPVDYYTNSYLKNKNKVVSPEAEELSILTYNVALIDLKGPTIRVKSPFKKEREKLLPGHIFSTDHHVIQLQEVFEVSSSKFFTKEAKKYGYEAVTGHREDYTDGLMTFIKKDIMEESSLTTRKDLYKIQDLDEAFIGKEKLASKRGLLEVSFRHKRFGDIHLFNTHNISQGDQAWARVQQMAELGEKVRLKANDKPGMLFITGDLNATPVAKNNLSPMNTVPHYTGLHLSQTDDLVIQSKNSLDDALSELNPHPDELLQGVNWKNTVDPVNNNLYKRDYKEGSVTGRLDHIWGRFEKGNCKVIRGKSEFTKQVTLSGGDSHLSDHFGVSVSIKCD